MAQVMFHPLFAGLVLTAVLAAIMSTMSSQMLVVSTSLIEDLFLIFAKKKPSQDVLINLSRTAVVGIAVIAAVLAINPSDSILGLVGFAWAGFGSAFGPLVLLSLYWKRLNSTGAIAGMVTGAIVAIGWGMSPLSDALYELVPGFAISLSPRLWSPWSPRLQSQRSWPSSRKPQACQTGGRKQELRLRASC